MVTEIHNIRFWKQEYIPLRKRAESRYSDAALRRVLGLETENKRPVLTTRPSLSARKALIMTGASELAKKESALYHCVAVRHDLYGGKLYTFKQKEEFADTSAFIALTNRIFPAVEQRVGGVPFRIKKTLFEKLGFSVISEDTITLPDREAFLARWAILQESDKSLPDLRIADSAGIATDMEYIWSYLSHDSLLSDGKEFVHDQLLHIAMLVQLIEGEACQYIQAKYRTVLKIARACTRIFCQDGEERPKLEFILGAFVDILAAETTNQSVRDFERTLPNFALGFVDNKRYGEFYRTRFGEAPPKSLIINLWNKVVPAFTDRELCSLDFFEGDTVLSLIDQGKIFVDEFPNLQGLTPLMAVAKSHNLKMIQELFRRKANPNIFQEGSSMRTALFFAVGDYDCFMELINHGADTTHKDKDGETALFEAVKNQSDPRIVSHLAKTSDVNTQDRTGRTALMMCVVRAKFLEAESPFEPILRQIELLRQHGASLEPRDKYGMTIHDIAQDIFVTNVRTQILDALR